MAQLENYIRQDHPDDDDDFDGGDDFFDDDDDEHGHVPDDLGYLYLVDALSWMFETFLNWNLLSSLQIKTQ